MLPSKSSKTHQIWNCFTKIGKFTVASGLVPTEPHNLGPSHISGGAGCTGTSFEGLAMTHHHRAPCGTQPWRPKVTRYQLYSAMDLWVQIYPYTHTYVKYIYTGKNTVNCPTLSNQLLASLPTAWLKWPKVDLSTLLGNLSSHYARIRQAKKKEFKKEFQYLRPPWIPILRLGAWFCRMSVAWSCANIPLLWVLLKRQIPCYACSMRREAQAMLSRCGHFLLVTLVRFKGACNSRVDDVSCPWGWLDDRGPLNLITTFAWIVDASNLIN